jgi:hypothetical protein
LAAVLPLPDLPFPIGNSLSHPFFFNSLLDPQRIMPKMFETFGLGIVSDRTVSDRIEKDARPLHITRSDCLNRNHAAPVAVVG